MIKKKILTIEVYPAPTRNPREGLSRALDGVSDIKGVGHGLHVTLHAWFFQKFARRRLRQVHFPNETNQLEKLKRTIALFRCLTATTMGHLPVARRACPSRLGLRARRPHRAEAGIYGQEGAEGRTGQEGLGSLTNRCDPPTHEAVLRYTL